MIKMKKRKRHLKKWVKNLLKGLLLVIMYIACIKLGSIDKNLACIMWVMFMSSLFMICLPIDLIEKENEKIFEKILDY